MSTLSKKKLHICTEYIRGLGEHHTRHMSSKPPPHLRSVIDAGLREVGGENASIPTVQDRVAFIIDRKRDALNCYLRTCCMRLAGDIVMQPSM